MGWENVKTFGNWENGEHLGSHPDPLDHLSAPPHLIKKEDDHHDHHDHYDYQDHYDHHDHHDHHDHDDHDDNPEEKNFLLHCCYQEK